MGRQDAFPSTQEQTVILEPATEPPAGGVVASPIECATGRLGDPCGSPCVTGRQADPWHRCEPPPLPPPPPFESGKFPGYTDESALLAAQSVGGDASADHLIGCRHWLPSRPRIRRRLLRIAAGVVIAWVIKACIWGF